MLKSTIGLVVVLLCCASAHAQQTQRGQAGGLREIIPGHYMCKRPTIHVCHIIVADDMFAL